MQRFFVDFPLTIDMTITDSDIIHQLTRVLRIQIGESIILFSWDEIDHEYEVTYIDKKSIKLRGISNIDRHTEPKKHIRLFQALPNKYDKIEYIIQKWVEIGISKFIFFRSERSQKLLITPNKIERFHLIAREALEQCYGSKMPQIQFLDAFPEEIDTNSHQLTLDTIWDNVGLLHYQSLESIWLWIGPEGGWSRDERQKMIDKGFIFARFWERVFRTETAGIVVAFGLMNV